MPQKTCERIERHDHETGVKVIQLTSFPLMHWHPGSGGWITTDDRVLLLHEQRHHTRNSPRDLYRIEATGRDLMLLAEDVSGGVISVDERYAYAGRGASIIRVPFEGGDVEEIHRSSRHIGTHICARSLDGRFVFGSRHREDGTLDVLRLDLADGAAVDICRVSYIMPVQIGGRGSDRLVASIVPIDGAGEPRMPFGVYGFSFDGDDFNLVPFTRSTNHYVPLGNTGQVVTTVNHPGCALDAAAPGDEETRVLAEGAGFWHVGADATGEWVAADTNWPDVGLQLVHAPSGRYRTLCHTGASGGHPQWTHAHPVVSPHARFAVFTSDKSGIMQLYLAEIPDELKSALRSGR